MISSHILDTTLGKPAANVELRLFNAENTLIATAFTNDDGRVLVPDFGLTHIEVGDYSIEFGVKEYFSKLNTETFFPKVIIHFSISDSAQHYHIPLLISPFAYSTYRGS